MAYEVVLICGDRNWASASTFQAAMERWVAKHGEPGLVIEGCARGADRMAEIWAAQNGIPTEHHPALWAEEGRAAGPRRNERMLARKPDAVIAFHADLANSRGTAHMVRIARHAGVPVWVAVKQPARPADGGRWNRDGKE